MHRLIEILGRAGIMSLVLAACVRADPLLISLPASLDSDESTYMARDVVELLARRTGANFELARHDNALAYLRDLESDRFALVFDGPHVLAALAEGGAMRPVVEFRHALSYVVVVPSRDQRVYQLRDLAGKPVCTGSLPDLFALHLAANIGNPTREPVVVPEPDHLRRLRRLAAGHCHAATLQTSRFMALSEREGSEDIRIIYKSDTLPGIGAAVSLHLEQPVREAIVDALLSSEGVGATRAMSIGFLGTEAPLAAIGPDRLRPLAGLMDSYFPR